MGLKRLPAKTFNPAAFRRLCVETCTPVFKTGNTAPAAFRRLCVETEKPNLTTAIACRPAAFRRLCVETGGINRHFGSGEPAAFRRLCVETIFTWDWQYLFYQPPSGGCVLKRDCHRETFVALTASRLQAAVC